MARRLGSPHSYSARSASAVAASDLILYSRIIKYSSAESDPDRTDVRSSASESAFRTGIFVALCAAFRLHRGDGRRLADVFSRQCLRARFSVSYRVVDGRGRPVARRDHLPAMGGMGELGIRRTAIRLLSAGVVDGWRRARFRCCRGQMVPGAFIWLALVAAGMSMWKLAREWLPGPQAIVAAVLFAVNPYHLVIVYYRSDFAELLAGAILPLVVWGALHVARGEWRRVPLLAVAFAGIWLSNAPAAVIATYSLGLIFVAECAARRSVRPLVPGAVAMAGGFGLAAFYILPAAWEQRWVQIAQAVADNLRPARNFLFTHANDPDFVLFNWKVSWVAAASCAGDRAWLLFSPRASGENSCRLVLGAGHCSEWFPSRSCFRSAAFVWRWTAQSAVRSISVEMAGNPCIGVRIFRRSGDEYLAEAMGVVARRRDLSLPRSARPLAQ